MSKEHKHIVIYGGGWIHNMGNSFIQLGSKVAIEQAYPDATVHIADGNFLMPPLPFSTQLLAKVGNLPLLHALKRPAQIREKRARNSQMKLLDLAKVDAVILSGVWLSAKYLKDHKNDFLTFKKHGIPLIINGGGGSFYDQQEIEEVIRLIKEIQPYAIITRDDAVYEVYKGILERVERGIDVGFFLSEGYKHLSPMPRHTVYCFDRGAVPLTYDIQSHDIVAHHAFKGMRHNTFDRGKTFYSELAEDYVHLYANCDIVYSDRVHACVAALSFGRKAQLVDRTPRAHLFSTVGATTIRSQPTQLDPVVFAQKKMEHVTTLHKVFASLWE